MSNKIEIKILADDDIIKTDQKTHRVHKNDKFFFVNPTSNALTVELQYGLTESSKIEVPNKNTVNVFEQIWGASKKMPVKGGANNNYTFTIKNSKGNLGGAASGTIHVEPDDGVPWE